MPRKQWIDKSKATTFQLVHRPQNDPRIHDDSSNPLVFRELAPSQSHKKSKTLQNLEAELFGAGDDGGDDDISFSSLRIRDNEGEAAEQGVYFDDTEYDYMQHIRDLNSGNLEDSGDSVFVEAYAGNKQKQGGGKGKNKMSLEEALRQSTLHDPNDRQDAHSESASTAGADSLLDDEAARAPGTLDRGTVATQQDMPDEIAGFRPDMDPRLREVLEALEDEAYVDEDEEGGFFNSITKGGEELSLDEFEADGLFPDDDDNDDGWESDATERPPTSTHPLPLPLSSPEVPPPCTSTASPTNPQTPNPNPNPNLDPEQQEQEQNPDWLRAFQDFKQQQKRNTPRPHPHPPPTITTTPSLANTSTTNPFNPRKKRRKGAQTSTSGYSMTSSSLARTEGLTLLDARFDRIERAYADDDDSMDMDMDTLSEINEDESINGDGDETRSIAASRTSRTSRTSHAPSIASMASRTSRLSTRSSQASAPPLVMGGAFEGMMDEFLTSSGISMGGSRASGHGGGGGVGGKRGRKNINRGVGNGGDEAMRALDAVREALGPARVSFPTAAGGGERGLRVRAT